MRVLSRGNSVESRHCFWKIVAQWISFCTILYSAFSVIDFLGDNSGNRRCAAVFELIFGDS